MSQTTVEDGAGQGEEHLVGHQDEAAAGRAWVNGSGSGEAGDGSRGRAEGVPEAGGAGGGGGPGGLGGIGGHHDPEWSAAVLDAAIGPMVQPHGRKWWLAVGALSAVVLAGFAAWGWQLTHGLGSAGYNDQAFWAVYIADVIAFIGVSYGGAVVSAILRLTGQSWRAPLTRIAEGMALVTVVIGALFIFPHLGRPERFLNIVAYPNMSSPLVWDFIAISTYTLATAIFFYLPLIPDLGIVKRALGAGHGRGRRAAYRFLSFGWLGTPRQRRLLHGALTIVALLVIPLAVSVHSVLSWAFALTSRPGWMETVFPPYFVIAALYSGTALVLVVVSAFRKGYHLERFITERHFVRLSYLMAALGLVYAYLTFVDMATEGYTGITTGWIRQTVSGAYAPAFWFYVVAGEILPLLIVAVKKTRTIPGITVAGVGVVLALWVKRIVIVLPPATQPLVAGKWGSYHFTWVSITVTLAGVAAIPLLLMVLFRFVPLLSIDEMEEAGSLGSTEQVARETTRAIAGGAPGPRTRVPAAAMAASPTMSPAPPGLPETGAPPEPPAPGRPPRRPVGWRRRWGLTAAVAGVMVMGASALFALGAHPAGASAPPAPAPPGSLAAPAGGPGESVTLSVSVVQAGKALLSLRAVASSPVGRPAAAVSGQRVTFFVATHEFDPGGLMEIASATTDGAGVATAAYLPTWTGQEHFVAQVTGATGAVAASGSETVGVVLDPPGVATSAIEQGRPLDTIGGNLVRGLLAMVAVVWVVLLGTLVVVVTRMGRLGREGREAVTES